MALTTSLADLSVLLVEPSAMQANLVKRMLEHQGVKKVTVVETASAALASLKVEYKHVIVISSLYLPDLAGTELVTAMRANAVVVPEESIVPTAGATYIWVQQDSTVTRREVELGVRSPGFVEIRRGIEVGDRVVVGGLERLVEGVTVKATTVERQPKGAREG